MNSWFNVIIEPLDVVIELNDNYDGVVLSCSVD